MADLITLVTSSGQRVTPLDDALIYEVFSGESGIIYGSALSVKNSTTIHIEAGHGLVCGRKFTVTAGDISVQLPTESLSGRVYIRLDLSNTTEPIQLLTQVAETLTPPVQEDDVNILNGVYEIDMAYFDASPSAVSGLSNVFPVIGSGSGSSNGNIATVENGSTASQPYAIGDYFIYSGQLYMATAAIAQGGTVSPGVNCAATTVGADMVTVKSALKLLISASDWSASTTAVNGQEYYTASKGVSRVVAPVPDAGIGAAPGSVLPTAEQEAAFACVDYVTADDATDTVRLYARTKPGADFYLDIKGVR